MGLFTYLHEKNRCGTTDLKVLVENYSKEFHEKYCDEVPLSEIKVAYKELPEVLKVMFKRGLISNKYFPGYEGIVKAMEEYALYERLIDEIVFDKK